MKRRILSVNNACEYLGGLGRVRMYELINSGEVQRVKIGRRSFITIESLDALIDRGIQDGAA